MEAWKKFLSQTKTQDLLEPHFKLLFARSDDTVLTTLKLLQENNILSVPVFDEKEKKWLGLVDVFDILTVLVFMSDLKTLIDIASQKEVDWYQFINNEMKVLQEENVATILNSSERNPWCPVSRLLPLHSLMDMFSKDLNLHRVPIVDDDGNVIGLVTQSKVINFLYKNVDQFPDTAAIKVKDSFVPSTVISIEADKTALDAYRLMVSNKVSGVAVVDKEGKLFGSISASDLKGSLESNLFHDLYLPIALYLEKGTPEFQRNLSQSPVSCTLETNIYELLHKLASNHIHRLFVVDSDRKPIGVYSLCDIISMMNFEHMMELGKHKLNQQTSVQSTKMQK